MKLKRKSLGTFLAVTTGSMAASLIFANVMPSDVLAAAKPKTVITWWTWNPNLSTQDAMIAAFEKQNPTIIVKPTNYTYNTYLVALKTAAAGGQLPDVFGIQVGGMAAQYQQYLLPLNAYARSAWGANWTKNFIPFGLSSVQLSNPPHDDTYYSLPTSLQSTSLWYNKGLFAKYRLPLPTTWPLLVKDAKVFSEHHVPPILLGGADGWQNEDIFLQIANQVAPNDFYRSQASNGKISFVTPGLMKALGIWKEMFTDKLFQAGAMSQHAYPNTVNEFFSGQGAMIPLGSWGISELMPIAKAAIGKDVGAVLFPQIPGGKPARALGGVDVAYGISNTSKNKQAAWKLLASITQGAGEDVYANTLSDLPGKTGLKPVVFTTKSAYPDALPLFKNQVHWLQSATQRNVTNPNLNQALINALAGVALGTTTPRQALISLNQSFQQP